MRNRFLLVLTALLAGCAEQPALAPRAGDEEADVYAIWRAAIRYQYGDTAVVVAEVPGGALAPRCPTCDAWLAGFAPGPEVSAVRPECLAPLRVTLFTRAELEALRVRPLPPSDPEVDALLRRVRDEWKRVHARFPQSGGVVRLSNVAFDASRTRAMILIFRSCGILCGYGEYLLLEKRGGDWAVLREMGLVAS